MKTYSAKPTDVKRAWYVLDAAEAPFGRLAAKAAGLLMGKGKPQFTHHIDCGDFVVVINSASLVVSGDKLNKKIYYRHTNYPGGLKETTLSEQMAKDPNYVIEHAIRGMLPDNKLRPDRLKRLKVYSGSEHNHEAQKPIALSMKGSK